MNAAPNMEEEMLLISETLSSSTGTPNNSFNRSASQFRFHPRDDVVTSLRRVRLIRALDIFNNMGVKQITFNFALILIATSSVAAQQNPQLPKPIPPDDRILLDRRPHLFDEINGVVLRTYPYKPTISGSRNSYRIGGPIKIRCIWRNTGKEPTTYDLADRDDYRKIDWPPLMRARVTDARGQVLTDNEFRAGGWWTSYRTGDFIIVNPVTLKPGEELSRIISLEKILLRAPLLPEGLKAGIYFVELSLGNLISNKVEIQVVAKD